MSVEVGKGLKATFLVHFVVAAAFGLVFMLTPELFGSLADWPMQEPAVYRLVGAAMLGYGASSWFSLKRSSWAEVRIVVLAEIVWTGLGALVMLWGMLYAALPPFGWVNTCILAAFAVAFTVFYLKQR